MRPLISLRYSCEDVGGGGMSMREASQSWRGGRLGRGEKLTTRHCKSLNAIGSSESISSGTSYESEAVRRRGGCVGVVDAINRTSSSSVQGYECSVTYR